MLDVKNLYASYCLKNQGDLKGKIDVLKNVSFKLEKGESLGLVGESGSGKSTLANCIIGLKEAEQGEIIFKDEKVYDLKHKKFSKNRKDIQMVFQNPYSSLNPRLKVRKIIGELMLHYKMATKDNLEEKLINILEKVRLDRSFLDKYPGELSGGQLQRISIARSICIEPDLLVLDEPTSALDLLIQKDILELLRDLQEELGLTYLFISHDLEVVRSICNRVIIMYKGEIVEEGSREEIFSNPKDAYTKKLIDSIPKSHPLD